MEENIIINFGILASCSWNSKKWADDPTNEDIDKSQYAAIRDNGTMHESLNFGHNNFPNESDGYYFGFSSSFNKLPDRKKSEKVQIVFFASSDYNDSNRKKIIGFYGRPIIDTLFNRKAKHEYYEKYTYANVKAHKNNIIYFNNPIPIDNEIVQSQKLLPKNTKISYQSFNYLNSNNVSNIILHALKLNPDNSKLKKFVEDFPVFIKFAKEKSELEDFHKTVDGLSPDNLESIAKLEEKMGMKTPEVKQRISNYIERGSISKQVKKATNFKCLVCEQLGENPHSFKKRNGEFFIETHHVVPVSTLKKGVLGITNLMTVCANHHRQLHFGDSDIIEITEKHFKLTIDSQVITINKITLPVSAK